MFIETVTASSGGADMSGVVLTHCNASGSYTSNSYTVHTSTGSHCCACAGVCMHVNGPWFCDKHGGNWNIWTDDNTSPKVPWVQPLPAVPNTFKFDLPEVKCFICKSALPLEEMLAGEKVCEECRTTIEAFKTILVKENEGGSK